MAPGPRAQTGAAVRHLIQVAAAEGWTEICLRTPAGEVVLSRGPPSSAGHNNSDFNWEAFEREELQQPVFDKRALNETETEIMIRWVLIKRFAALTGYTEDAVRAKIHSGVFVEGVHYRKAPDGRIAINLEVYDRWVAGERLPLNPVPRRPVR